MGNIVTAGSIRNSLGSSEGTSLKKCPSLYAVRLAQAFTATDTPFPIRSDQWEMVDVCTAPYLFTDGVGTISRKTRSGLRYVEHIGLKGKILFSHLP